MTRVFVAATVIVGATAALLAVCAGDANESASTSGAPATTADSTCVISDGGALPQELYETSGIAAGSNGIMWTHNDGSTPLLYALAADGRVVRRVRIERLDLEDWEDIESGPCNGGRCLYIADTGDNDGNRRFITIHVVAEPADGATTTVMHASLQARYPNGPQDAEALFVLPGGELFVVSKGRQRPSALYRYPGPYRPADLVTLEHVRELAPQPADPLDRVTAGTASPDGQWVALRTYRTLLLYPAAAFVSNQPVTPVRIDLTPLGHRQGEALAFDGAGNLWVTSEASRGQPVWARLSCRLPTAR